MQPRAFGGLSPQPIFEAIHRGLLQRDRLLKLDTPLGANALIPLRAIGEARLGRDYTWTIDAASTRDDLNLDALMAQPVTLWLQLPRGTFDFDSEYRPIHGYVHKVQRLGADGGLTTYQIGFSSALHFLRHRRDEHYWLDRDATAILSDVFNRYPQLQGAFQFKLSRPLAVRSYCRQSETDWNFAERLMEDEGLYGYWAHADNEQKTTYVIVDRVSTLPDAKPIGFYRGDVGDEVDRFTQWTALRQLNSVAVASRSGDYKRPTSPFEVQSTVQTTSYTEQVNWRTEEEKKIPYPQLEHYSAGAYRYPDSDRGGSWAQIRAEEYESRSRRFFGVGGSRWIDIGGRFVLDDHPAHTETDARQREFVAVAVRWTIQNNVPIVQPGAHLPYSLQADVERVRSSTGSALAIASHPQDGSVGVYVVEVEAQRTDVEYRSPFDHPKPVMTVEMATVVTPNGEEIWTDALNRVKVRFHWDRQSPAEAFNTSPALLIAQSDTGERYGGVHVPRRGETIYIDFVGGDCDRPYVVSRAPGGATPPMWHSHGLFSGFQSREYGGGGGYNEVQLDDATGQTRARLLSTTGSDYSHLTLGYAIVQQGNTRGRFLGLGYTLHADRYGAIRANRGLYVGTYEARHDGDQLDVDEAREQLKDAADVMAAQSSLAEQHRAASLKDGHAALTHFTDATQQSSAPETKGGRTAGGGTGSANTFRAPLMLLGSAAGIGLSTPQSIQVAADQHVNVVAGKGAFVATGKSLAMSVGEAASLFAQEGVKMFSKGPVQIESHGDNIGLIAQKILQILSTTGRIEIAADQEILITCGEAYIRIAKGNIEIHAPGKIDVKGSLHSFNGPASMPFQMPTLPDAVCVPCMMKRAAGRSPFVTTGA
ncbi:type VI secretion system tip protein VgrG [Paraburkholderia lacunae]|uniref:Type VI secretion system tip protein VgrG n=2 Tax=Paraburkholderia lacunae TaxID=2211104 RepID=A0A370NBE8_9BURK|nr:type VI secretion system tip protein VgrG [Paraburkholderia lacunae]